MTQLFRVDVTGKSFAFCFLFLVSYLAIAWLLTYFDVCIVLHVLLYLFHRLYFFPLLRVDLLFLMWTKMPFATAARGDSVNGRQHRTNSARRIQCRLGVLPFTVAAAKGPLKRVAIPRFVVAGLRPSTDFFCETKDRIFLHSNEKISIPLYFKININCM